MMLGQNFPSVFSIGEMSQEFKSGTLTNPMGDPMGVVFFKVGYPQINL